MLRALRREPGFYPRLIRLALPVVLQNLITTSLGFADTFMVGLLGNAEMAAVTAANVPVFIIQLCIFGFQSGMAILVSQYWGRSDTENISRCFGIALYSVTVLSLLISFVCVVFPAQVMGLITPNPDLIALGTGYLRVVALGVVFNAISTIFIGLQRSTEFPTFGMIVFGASMAVNLLLNYVLIFGKFGAPALGIVGAAAATSLSRLMEFIIVVVFALRDRRLTLHWKCILRPGKRIFRSFIRYSTPVVLNETLWGTGNSMLTVIMGHMANSQDMLAAYSLIGNVHKLSSILCFGLASSASVIVGKEIGMGRDRDHVQSVSWTLLLLSLLAGGCVAVLLFILLPTFFLPVLFPLFQLSPGATEVATCLAVLFSLFMPLISFDITNVTGVLRAGGDSRTAAIIDIVPLWGVAIPLMALTGLVLDAPVWGVCVAMLGENFLKCPLGLARFRTKKWINDITRNEE